MATVYAQPGHWGTSDDYICSQSEANASYIWAYFIGQGWSKSAVAGLVGNTTYESYNNPAFHEVGGSGFGIVQWTPASNYTSWANPRGFPTGSDCRDPEKYLRGQCERIVYEWKTGIEFYGSSRYGRNFTMYNNWESYIHQETLTPEEAAYCFLSNYERPRYDAAMASLSKRQGYARRWYDMFSSASGTQQTKVAHEAAVWAVGIAENTVEYNGYKDHGYDQDYRWGEHGDFDCSSLVISAYDSPRANMGLKAAGATYTGNMRSVMLAKGFQDVTSQINLQTGAGLIEGDVLLNTVHHTAMAVEGGKIVQASINERRGTRGGKPGDQTGTEIAVKEYYNYPWNYVLRYDGYSGFGIETASKNVSIIRAVPVTTSDWTKQAERNG